MLIEVRKVQDDVWDEASLKDSQQTPRGQEGGSSRQPELRAGDNAPQDHLRWDPTIGPNPLADQLRGQFGTEESEPEDSIAQVVVCTRETCQHIYRLCRAQKAHTIGGQIHLWEKIVRKGLTQVGSVQFQSHEHDTSPYHDS